MKKILIVREHLPQLPSELATLPFVSDQKESPDEIAAAFVHKNNEAAYQSLRAGGVDPLFVVGDDFIEYTEGRAGRINLPRPLYEERLPVFLRQYQTAGTIDPGIFQLPEAEFAQRADREGGSEAAGALPLQMRSLRVQGVKSALDSGPLTLPPLAVLVGRNATGKSTLLEALQWLQEVLQDGLVAATAKRYHSFQDLCTRGRDRVQIDLSLVGGDDGPPRDYRLVVGTDGAVPVVLEESCRLGDVEEITTDVAKPARVRQIRGGNPVSDRDRLALSQVGAGATGAQDVLSFLRRATFLRLYPRAIARPGALQLTPGRPPLDEEGASLPALLDGLDGGARERLLAYLQETLGALIRGVDLDRNAREQTGVLVVDQRTLAAEATDRLPAWVLSEGTRRLAALYAVMVARPAPSLLVIEEIENGLDPWTLSEVLRALRIASDQGLPVLLTTHSPYFLDKFGPESIIHVVYEDGRSVYRAAATYETVMKYEGEVPSGVLYTEGCFRAEP